MKTTRKFVDFNDPSIPVGKRKVAYVRYAMMHGTPLETAKLQAARKFKVRETGMVAPKMHYYVVMWNGNLGLRNCSEHIMTDERVVMLIHKEDWYLLESIARIEGRPNPINWSEDEFVRFYNKHKDKFADNR